jgi:hypothetical protein
LRYRLNDDELRGCAVMLRTSLINLGLAVIAWMITLGLLSLTS